MEWCKEAVEEIRAADHVRYSTDPATQDMQVGHTHDLLQVVVGPAEVDMGTHLALAHGKEVVAVADKEGAECNQVLLAAEGEGVEHTPMLLAAEGAEHTLMVLAAEVEPGSMVLEAEKDWTYFPVLFGEKMIFEVDESVPL